MRRSCSGLSVVRTSAVCVMAESSSSQPLMAAKSVLIVNMGSSSLKWVVLDATTESVLHHGDAHWTGAEGGRHGAELEAALAQVPAVDAVGHRVVHGGARFTNAVIIDDEVRREIDRLSELAPLHNPAALAGIDAT